MDLSPSDKLAYCIPEAVSASGLGRSKLYEFIREKRLQTVKIGGRTLILRTDLEAFLSAAKSEAA